MQTIIFFNQKGGVGKSSCAFNLSLELDKLYKVVVVVDLDPQKTLSDFFKRRTKNSLHHKCKSYFINSVEELEELIKNLTKEIDYLIIDSQGMANLKLINFAKKSKSLIIIPTTANVADITSSNEVIEQMINFDFNYKVLLNKINPSLKKGLYNLFSELKDINVKVLNSYIKDLAVHRLSVEMGKTSFEYNKNEEFINLAKEISSINVMGG